MKSLKKIVHKNRKRILFTVTLLFIIMAFSLLFYALTPVDNRNVTSIVDIPKGTSFIQSVDILESDGLIKNRHMFYLLVISKNVHRHIRAGEYELSTSMSPMDILNKLVSGEIKYYRVTIPEDFTAREIAARLISFNLIEEKAFMNLSSDSSFLRSLGIESPFIEGYLYPDTYHLDRSMSTRDIMKIMVDRFWKALTPEMRKRADEIGMSIPEIVTLASIIGKESGYRSEKALISAVFHNRLKKNMRLQSDPTAIYNLESFEGKVKRSHLKRETPYNTYQIDGLPPGPIGNPAIDSIHAALYPASVKYLYFVSNNDGSHQFSSNLNDHNQAVLRYQIERKKE
jgi:UPF0755 protein